MSFVRTVLGDIAPGELGVCYAHEHIIIDRSYWRAYGGSPGLCYLLTTFRRAMAERGLGEDVFHRIFVENPARVYAFARRRASCAS